MINVLIGHIKRLPDQVLTQYLIRIIFLNFILKLTKTKYEN